MLLDEVSKKSIYEFMQEVVSKISVSDKPVDFSDELDYLFDQRLASFKKRDEVLKMNIRKYLKIIESS